MTNLADSRLALCDGDTYPSFWHLRRAVSDPVAFLQRQAAIGDLVRFRLGDRPVYLVNHPALIEQVLVTHGEKFSKAPAVQRARRLLGSGLLGAEPPVHTERRRLMLPAFHRQKLEQYATAMTARASALCDGWSEGQTIDIAASMRRLALAIVGDTLVGTDLVASGERLQRLLNTALISLDPIVTLVARRARVAAARRRLLAMVGEIVDRRRHQPGHRHDLLTLLLDANRHEPNDDQLLDDLLTMVLAGHDTIASAMTWCWAALAAHPDVDAQLAAEVATVCGSRLPAAADLPQLLYTRAVLSEALRLWPPAWLLARRAVVSVEIGATTIPQGGLVFMSPTLVHRDARFFADPLEFRPARWLAGEAKALPKLAYFPFGAGRRSCIGEHFAWMEGILVLATVARRWRLERTSGPPAFDIRITMRPRGAVEVRCTARQPR